MASKLSKEQKEAQFIAGVEQILGFMLVPWQRELIIEIRAQSLSGREIDVLELQNKIRAERSKRAAAIPDGGA